jgi:hypothetical protein
MSVAEAPGTGVLLFGNLTSPIRNFTGILTRVLTV